jgi:hypothetical protein
MIHDWHGRCKEYTLNEEDERKKNSVWSTSIYCADIHTFRVKVIPNTYCQLDLYPKKDHCNGVLINAFQG